MVLQFVGPSEWEEFLKDVVDGVAAQAYEAAF